MWDSDAIQDRMLRVLYWRISAGISDLAFLADVFLLLFAEAFFLARFLGEVSSPLGSSTAVPDD